MKKTISYLLVMCLCFCPLFYSLNIKALAEDQTMLSSEADDNEQNAASEPEESQTQENEGETQGETSPSAAENSDAELGITSEAVVLMESTTGEVIFQKNADTRLSPASITKIMTLLLIFEALEDKKITLNDEVTTSAYAKSMGGSQVFLEEGEKQTVETLIKCIVVASGNDASVAMAEHLAGSEAEFVNMMNKRAKELGMENTNFEDCCGLTDSSNHYTTARDVAIMSRELSINYPAIHNYSTIWMEDIVHVTNKGSSNFTLSNTNKLLRQYDGCTGLKTGSTSIAKYCLSATASRNGIDLIAVVLAAPQSAVRFNEAATLLNYGFSTVQIYKDEDPGELEPIIVKKGVNDSVGCEYQDSFSYLSTTGENLEDIVKEWRYDEDIDAPVEAGQQVGRLVYLLDGKEIGEVPIIAAESVDKATYMDHLKKVWRSYLKVD